ncbi:uncharacterized protein E5676_scaffold228G00550 [Cucumis melo var. makuwa]|uniref:Uncharacterized protein n=1 Tax=Cucumis melo var. makuwa TaxID=1194695 RepID=A0A5D3DA26_CUCMM|nr:uncharacterized protein E5676_scaffold228G00550 [Cucumis melo var. makuwa]
MIVCFEVRLEEDRVNAMEVLTNSTTNSTTFSARSSTHDNDKNNGKPIPVCKKRSSNEKQNSRRAHVSETTTASTSQSTSSTASQTKTPTLGVIAQSGMPQTLGLVSVDGKNSWILDSRDKSLDKFFGALYLLYPCAGMSSGKTIGTSRHSEGLY